MKLVGNLKKLVEQTKNKEEAKDVIGEAGMLLTDDELNNVIGGVKYYLLEEGICQECANPLDNGICINPDCILCGIDQPY